MPRFSLFTGYGLLRYSGKPSGAQDIYESIVAGESGAFDMTQGAPAEAEAYALAMACARARAVLERAKNQRDPNRSFDMLPALEKDFGIVPGETDTIRQRQRAVSARKIVSRGSRAESIENALLTLLGADFITYRVLTTDEKETWPAHPSAGPGVFGRDDIPAKVFELDTSITSAGAPVTFTYSRPDDDVDLVRLTSGDVVCIDPGNLAQAEKVTIASATGLTATATFTKSHGAGTILTTGPIPIWTSTKRRALVVVAATAVFDPEKRRKIHDLMGRISRGVTTWSIVKASSPTTVGPLLVGGVVGTTIGTLTIP